MYSGGKVVIDRCIPAGREERWMCWLKLFLERRAYPWKVVFGNLDERLGLQLEVEQDSQMLYHSCYGILEEKRWFYGCAKYLACCQRANQR